VPADRTSPSRRRPKPTWLRWLARDHPGAHHQVMRIRDKAALELRRRRPRKSSAPLTVGQDITALRAVLDEFGLEPGDTVMVHSSWERAAALAPSPLALIEALRDAVGETGTLCMPAYTRQRPGRPVALDVRRSPSAAGLVTEVFRRSPGVLRSAQLRTVAAQGPNADLLVGDHHRSPYASGPLSPYVRIAEVGGKVLSLGVGPEDNTMFHCGEDVLVAEFPVSVYEDPATEVHVVDIEGHALTVPSYERSERWTNCCDAVRMLPYFEDMLQRRVAAGVDAYLVPADRFLERLLGLARGGIHMYGFRFPSPSRTGRL
jgi:aminoglycoside 3-N-acetyltransferase